MTRLHTQTGPKGNEILHELPLVPIEPHSDVDAEIVNILMRTDIAYCDKLLDRAMDVLLQNKASSVDPLLLEIDGERSFGAEDDPDAPLHVWLRSFGHVAICAGRARGLDDLWCELTKEVRGARTLYLEDDPGVSEAYKETVRLSDAANVSTRVYGHLKRYLDASRRSPLNATWTARQQVTRDRIAKAYEGLSRADKLAVESVHSLLIGDRFEETSYIGDIDFTDRVEVLAVLTMPALWRRRELSNLLQVQLHGAFVALTDPRILLYGSVVEVLDREAAAMLRDTLLALKEYALHDAARLAPVQAFVDSNLPS